MFRPLAQFARHFVRGQIKEKLKHFDNRPDRAILKYFFGGILANREEYYISQTYPSQDRAHVLSIHLFGMLVIQERGEVLSENLNAETHPLWQLMLRKKDNDLDKARAQFANFGGKVKLIDLGRGDLDPAMFP